MADHDAKSLAQALREPGSLQGGRSTLLRAARMLEQQSVRITDLETQVAGDAVKLHAAVDEQVRLQTRIGELEAELEEQRQHALERSERE